MSLKYRVGRLEGRSAAPGDAVFIWTGVPRADDVDGPAGALVRGGWLGRPPGEAVEALVARVAPLQGEDQT